METTCMETYSFGTWMKKQRMHLRLTQKEVATAVYCSTAMIKKIEADERHPSVELAEALATTLQIPIAQHQIFVACARGERPLDHLQSPISNLVAEGHQSPISPLPHLPIPATPFLGRAAELADITSKLRQPDCRLLTLLGPGGMGKTRLAIEAGRQLQATFKDGVVFVNLTAITDPTLIPDTIAHALDLSLPGPATKHLPRVLRQRQMLILLDNCEQLGDGMGWLSTLLAAAPNITLLATSRERLLLAEEWVLPVTGLDESRELFAQTAIRVKPDFNVDEEETAVGHICQLVGNLPLAVELAASWIPFMSCSQIANHIQKGLDILATTVRNIPARHRSMQAVFDASWQLLTEREQDVLMRLSVFRGGWRLEEATEIANANLILLRGLAEKSLVRVKENGRFDLHELTRQYAAAQLQVADTEKETRQKHTDTFFALAQRFFEAQSTPEGPTIFNQMHQELNNTQTALQWLMDTAQGDYALRFVAQLSDFWFWGGYRTEGVHWLEAVLAQTDKTDNPARCEALLGMIPMLAFIGRGSEALVYINQAKAMAYRLEEPMQLIRILVISSQYLADRTEAEVALQEAISLNSLLKEETAFIGAAYILYGDLLRETGQYAAAREYYLKADAISRHYGTDLFGSVSGNLGRLALQEGDLIEAYTRISYELQHSQQRSNHKGVMDWLVRLGEVETYLEYWEAAQAHLLECFQLMESTGDLRGQADVSAGLGYLALQRREVATAVSHLQNSLHWYAELMPRTFEPKIRTLTPELVDAILRAGLAAAANRQPAQAATLFTAVTRFGATMNHAPPPPLEQAMNEALTAVQSILSSVDYKAAVTAGQKLPLPELLTLTIK